MSGTLSLDSIWTVQPEGGVTLTGSMPTSEDLENFSEKIRTAALASALLSHVAAKNIKVAVSQTLETQMDGCCNFSGGGDVFLFGKEYLSCVILCDDEGEGEEIEEVEVKRKSGSLH